MFSAPDPVEYLLVEERGKVVGVVGRNSALEFLGKDGVTAPIREVSIRNFEAIKENTTLLDVVLRMQSRRATLFLVSSGAEPVSVQDVKGVISKERIADAMTESVVLSQH
jgi:predicted transcriptional regulator